MVWLGHLVFGGSFPIVIDDRDVPWFIMKLMYCIVVWVWMRFASVGCLCGFIRSHGVDNRRKVFNIQVNRYARLTSFLSLSQSTEKESQKGSSDPSELLNSQKLYSMYVK